MKRGKLLEPDVLRTLAFLGVVAQHILGAYARREVLSPNEMKAISFVFELTRFSVPLFVFLFAAMLYYQHYNKLTYLPYLWKRTKQLLLPYAIWTAFYLYYAHGLPGLHPLSFGNALLKNNGAYHLWYVGMIFQFVLVSPVMIAIVSKLLKLGNTTLKKILLCTGLFALCLAYIGLTPNISSNNEIINNFFNIKRSKIFLSWLVFYFAGAFCGIYYNSFRYLVKKIWIPCGAIFVASLILIFNSQLISLKTSGTVNLFVVSFLNPGFCIVTLITICFLFGLSMLLSRSHFIMRICSFIGGVSYQAYLAHVMCINILNKYTISVFSSRPVYYLWLFISVSVVSILVGYIERCIKKCFNINKQRFNMKASENT